MDYSISLNGIFAAQRSMQQAAQRISEPNSTTDYAAEMVAVEQAKIADKANLRLISVERDLESGILDILG